LNKIKINTAVSEGKLTKHRKLIADCLQSFEGKEITITFEKIKNKRSNQQNSYYWGVVIECLRNGLYEATGEYMTANDIHYSIILPKFAPENEIVNKNTGEIITKKITSSGMTKEQFSEFIEKISKFASEWLNVEIPSANDEIQLN